MKGLLLKDVFVVSEFVRVLSLMAIVFIASMMAIDGFSVIGAMISLLVVSLVISSFSYDDLAHWDSFADQPQKAGRFQISVSASAGRAGDWG